MVPRADLTASLLHRTELTPTSFLVRLGIHGVMARPVPGQFVMVGAAEGDAVFWRRAFSVAGFGTDGEGCWMELMIREVGPGTAFWRRAPEGTRARVLGPLGNGFPLDDPPASVALVAGGIGLPPLLYAAAELARSGTRCDLFLGAATAEELIEPERCARAAAETGGVFVPCTDDGSAGERGLVTEVLARRLEEGETWTALWACGPTPMLRAAASVAVAHGLEARLALEERMACGLGVCLGCVVPGREGDHLRVCTEGPVVRGDAVDWEAL